jgi:hypothetical protein
MVIGGTKDQAAQAPKKEVTFNFVITFNKPFTVTNLTTKVNITRVVLEGGKLANVNVASTAK